MHLDKIIDWLISLPQKIGDLFKPKTDLESRVDKYADIQGVSTRELNFGLWYRRQTKLLFLLLVWFLVVAAAVLWSYSLYYLTNYLLTGVRENQKYLEQLSQPVDVVHYDYDSKLLIGQAQVIALKDGYYDLSGTLTNNNDNAWGTFSFYFVIDGKRQEGGQGFILPNETKMVAALNQQIPGTATQATMALEGFTWHRLDAHKIPNWDDFKASHLDFAVYDKIFTPADQTGLTQNLEINNLSFSITNKTPFNYKQAPFLAILYNGDKIVGVNRYVGLNFVPQSQLKASLSVVGHLPPITSIDVVPDVNLFDEGNYGPIQ